MKATALRPAPPLIVWMSFPLVIFRWVGLHQSPLPLRQPTTIVAENRRFE